MRIEASRLATDGLVVELPNEQGDPDRVELGKGALKRGVLLTSPQEIRLDSLASDALELVVLRFFLDATRRVEASALALGGATVDLRIARGLLHGRHRLVGALGATEAKAKNATLELEGLRLTAASLAVKGLFVQLGADGARRVEIAALELGDARLELGGTVVTLGALTARAVAATLGEAGTEVKVGSVGALGVEVVTGSTKVRASELALPRGASYDAAGVACERATIAELAFALALAPRATPKSEPGAGPGLDLRLLDQLQGHVHVDVTVDAKVPVIKRRVATHELRVHIEDGVIDFHELERDLSLLEDAILDFEFEGDRLILEKDLPLIPFDNQTLVFWQLDDEGKRLAADRRVRLRTLAQPSLPDAGDAKPGAKSSFELVRLDFDPLEAKLRLKGPGRFALPGGAHLRVGDVQRPGIADLELKAAIRHRADNPSEPGQIEVRASGVCLGLEGLAVGERTLGVDGLVIASTGAITVSFEGLSPRRVEGTLRGVEITGASLGG